MYSIKEHSISTTRKALSHVLDINDVRQLPKINNSSVSYSFINHRIKGRAGLDSVTVCKTLLMLELVTGQRPVLVKSKKDSAALKIRKGQLIGAKVNLSPENSQHFLERYISIVLPSLPIFESFSLSSMDARGNFSFSVSNIMVFPELSMRFDIFRSIKGKLNINVCTTAQTKEEGVMLISLYQIPFSQ